MDRERSRHICPYRCRKDTNRVQTERHSEPPTANPMAVPVCKLRGAQPVTGRTDKKVLMTDRVAQTSWIGRGALVVSGVERCGFLPDRARDS
jgi:hypothetical protein